MYKFSNKDNEFLKKSDLVIFYNEKPQNFIKNVVIIGGESDFSKVDFKRSSKNLPLLFARLSYVFEIYDERLKESEEFEDFVEILKGVRVKKEIKKHDTTLEEVAGFLYLMDNAKKISVIIGEADEEELMALFSFLNMFDKEIGIFSSEDLSEYEFKFYEV